MESIQPRHLILHFHIFKNAGSTVDTFLNYNFPGQCGGIEGRSPGDTLCSDDILRFAQREQHLKAISSHQARLPVPVAPDIVFHPVLFLRHPIDRAASVYYFDRRQPYNQLHTGVCMAHENSLAGYVRWALGEGNHAVMRNFQTIYLAGRERDMGTAYARVEDLQSAMANLSALPVFGIVEDFDRSLKRIVHHLSTHFGRLKAKYRITNRSTERRSRLEDRLREVERMLGPRLYLELLEQNSYDIQLYQYGRKLIGLPPC